LRNEFCLIREVNFDRLSHHRVCLTLGKFLSWASNISFNTIKRIWKNPYGGANINTLNKIAQTLGVSLAELTEEEEDDNQQ
jgi:Cro/C1-type HTH DNA-binding domain